MKYLKYAALTLTVLPHLNFAMHNNRMQPFAYYQNKTHEFLTNLGAHNANTVRVERLQTRDNNTLGHTSFVGTIRGNVMTHGTYRICLNENAFRNISESMRLFTCAHEAAHYTCNHPMRIMAQGHQNNVVQFEQEADEYAARMLCANGYMWVVQDVCNNAQRLVTRGQGHVSPDQDHPTYGATYNYLSRILQQHRQQGATAQPRAQRGQRIAPQPQRTPQRQAPAHRNAPRTTQRNQCPAPRRNAQQAPVPQQPQSAPVHQPQTPNNDHAWNSGSFLYPFATGMVIYLLWHMSHNNVQAHA